MSDDKTPDVTPTPAIIKPTSPLEIIPIPTFIDFVLSLKNMKEVNPHPSNFVDMAFAIIIPEINKTSKLIPRKST